MPSIDVPLNLPPPPLPPKPQPPQAGGSATPANPLGAEVPKSGVPLASGSLLVPPPPKAPLPPPAPKPSRRGSNGDGFGGGGLRVSLMPTEGNEPSADISRRLAIMVVVLAVEALVIGGIYFWLKVVTDRRTELLADYELKRGTVEKSYTTQAEDIADAQRFDEQVKTLGKHLDDHVYWTAFFDLLERHTRPTVTYSNFSGDVGTGVVTLEASGRTYRDIAEQIVLLRKNPLVLDVRTTSATTKVDSGGNITGVGFALFLHLRPEAWKKAAPPSTEK